MMINSKLTFWFILSVVVKGSARADRGEGLFPGALVFLA
jgi:hypothetical protein